MVNRVDCNGASGVSSGQRWDEMQVTDPAKGGMEIGYGVSRPARCTPLAASSGNVAPWLFDSGLRASRSVESSRSRWAAHGAGIGE
jgi:hypothetical protein